MGLALGLTAVTALLFLASILLYAPGFRDYTIYWATGQLLAHHGNPYDSQALSALERARGLSAVGYMRNPPWALPVVWPMGFIGAKAGGILWTLILLAAFLAAVWIAWQSVRTEGHHLAWLGFLSPVAINDLFSGQTAVLALLGLAVFLRLHQSRPFVAGIALWLCALKPHLLVPWASVLLLWIVLERAWMLLAGSLTALAVSCATTAWINPHAWRQYLDWAHSSGIPNEKLPCVSVALRNLIDPAANWLTYLPATLACAWAVVFFWHRRRQWDWQDHGGLLVMVSLAVTPYCWAWDQCLGIPALLFAACRTQSRMAMSALALSYIAVDIMQIAGFGMHSPGWIWLGPFWLGWYVWARKSFPDKASSESTAIPALSVG